MGTRDKTKKKRNEKVHISKIPWHGCAKTSQGRKRNLLNSNVLDTGDTGISPGKQVVAVVKQTWRNMGQAWAFSHSDNCVFSFKKGIKFKLF